MKQLILAVSLAALTRPGCAQLKEWSQDAHAGATSAADESPYPKRYPNDHYYVP